MIHAVKPFCSRADLHVHSRYSDRPSEWVLRRIGAPECFVEPRHVYERAIAAGMNYVTISDHNKIDGALEIAHLPNTFISSEITTYFPENGAKMHVLVTGIREDQFQVIQELRENIYAFRRFLIEDDIVYSVAHPLFLVNEKLTLDQFEKLLVMFDRFEQINGTCDARASRVLTAILENLTPQMIERLADKHDIEPIGERSHRKWLTGGSDDHSGQYIASAHTITPQAATVDEFIEHLRMGNHEPGGGSGSSVQLAHCFYHIAYGYYKDRILRDPHGGGSLLGEMFKRLLERPAPAASQGPRGIRQYVGGWLFRRKVQRMSPTEQLIVDEFAKLYGGRNGAAPVATTPSGLSDAAATGMSASQAFEISCRLAHSLGHVFAQRLIEKAVSGDLIKTLESFAAVGPVVAAITPYLAAFKTQHKDERFIQKAARHFAAANEHQRRSERKAWVTDTFNDVNGVARTIHTLATLAQQRDEPLTVLTCVEQAPSASFAAHNFEPVGKFDLPEYPSQKLSFPPFLQILEHIERERYSELIISTPGPMGLTALMAARLLHLRTVGIYHTDFPHYVRQLTDDEGLEALAWRYMSWFFDQCDVILAPSEYYRDQLIDHGFGEGKVRVLRRGVDLRRFTPERRDENTWVRYGGRTARTLLYVGRVSDEKNVGTLVAAFRKLLETRSDVQLAIVGSGPQLEQLQQACAGCGNILFTGSLEGDALERAYASADAFVFPSTSDTFGNAVLEAQASGLPAIVSDRGGPQEIVKMEDSGLVVDLDDSAQAVPRLAEAMGRLIDDHEARARMRERALRMTQRMSWSSVLDDLLSACAGDEVKASQSAAPSRSRRQPIDAASLAAPVL